LVILYTSRSNPSGNKLVTSFLIEAIFSFALFLLLIFLYSIREKYLVLTFKGWDKLLLGIFVLLLGSLFDLTGNFASVQRVFLLGNLPLDLVLKIGFYTLGMILVVSGPLNWLSEILEWKKKTKEKERIVNLLVGFSAKGRGHKSLLDMFNFVLVEVDHYFQVEFGAIFLLDDLKEFLILESHVGLSSNAIHNLERIRLDDSAFSRVVKDGTAQLTNDIFSEEKKLALHLKEDNLESLLAAPIVAKGKVSGVLAVFSKERFKFNQEDAKLVLSLGEQMGEIVENMRLGGELMRKDERLKKVESQAKLISKITSVLSSVYQTDEVLDRLTLDSLQMIEASAAVLFSIEGEDLILRSSLNEDSIGKRMRISDFPLIGEVIEKKKPMVKTELFRGSEPESVVSKRRVKSSLAVPLLSEDKVLGVLLFENHEHVRTYSAWEIEQVQTLANLATLVLEKDKTNKELQAMVGERRLGASLGEWSNDVNNLLAGILGNIQLLEENIKDKRVISAHQTTEYLKTVEEAVLATSRMVKRIQNIPVIEKEEILPKRKIAIPREELVKPEVKKEKEIYKVLVVDDQEIIRDLVQNILKGMGYQSVLASSGREGLEKFREERFDLVITDLGMPDISGWEVASDIKKQREDIPIILITGWGIHPDPNKIKDSGINFLLTKPFKVDQLEKVIQDAVELIQIKK
jgi:CheY-like chemotaxis protein/GAF domain-containing protein